MNSEIPRPPSDHEIDRLLASRLRRTSPAFEMRWRELRAELSRVHSPVRSNWMRWLLWPSLATASLAVLAMVVVMRRAPTPTPNSQPVTFEELIALDAALQPARPLLVAENRDALLNLPAQPRN